MPGISHVPNHETTLRLAYLYYLPKGYTDKTPKQLIRTIWTRHTP